MQSSAAVAIVGIGGVNQWMALLSLKEITFKKRKQILQHNLRVMPTSSNISFGIYLVM